MPSTTLLERAGGARERGRPVVVDDDHLGDHRVVERWDLRALLDGRVHANAGPERRHEPLDDPGCRREAAGGVLRVDPHLDGVAATRRTSDDAQRLARGDPHLLAHDVDARDELRDGVLDLQAAVHLDEVRLPSGPRTNSNVPAPWYPTETHARATDASISSRVSGVSAGEGDSSRSFW